MANNRLYLRHRPSGKSVFLGKRMALGWYVNSRVTESLERFFRLTIIEGGQDDFELLIEDGTEAPKCRETTPTEKWDIVGGSDASITK